MPTKLIRSAGGVVWRPAGDDVEVAIVHRDRYDDWSLPKGKLDRGEHLLAAAVREVREETGIVGIPQVRLPSIRYLTGEPDTEKTVDFWSMHAFESAGFVANDEVSELRWVSVGEAAGLLTYVHDRGVVTSFAGLPQITGVAVFVRHAHAGSRKRWDGPDELRPLDADGTLQAAALGPLLSLFKPIRVYAAPLTRCIDTVAPIGLPVRTDTVFAAATAAPPKAVADRIRRLVAEHQQVVIASQGEVIPPVVAELHAHNVSATTTLATPKGAAWVLSFAGTDVVAADRLSL
jgi:8-oxo-dGTP pyrophosphatase MutT (NUDIX family)